MSSRRAVLSAAVVAVGLSVVLAAGVLAGNGRFSSARVTLSSSGSAVASLDAAPANLAPQLDFSWVEKGLGSADVTYVGSADLVAGMYCVNNGGNKPTSTLKGFVNVAVSVSNTFGVTRNGTVSVTFGNFLVPATPFDLSTLAGSSTLTCPNANYTLVAQFDHYENIGLLDATNGVSAPGLPSRLP